MYIILFIYLSLHHNYFYFNTFDLIMHISEQDWSPRIIYDKNIA